MKLKFFFCQFPNPWALRVSGMGGYTSKCEKSQNHCTLIDMLRYENVKNVMPAKVPCKPFLNTLAALCCHGVCNLAVSNRKIAAKTLDFYINAPISFANPQICET
jgi:hypothetical protein